MEKEQMLTSKKNFNTGCKKTWSMLFLLGISTFVPWVLLSTTMKEFKILLDSADHGNFTTTTNETILLQEYFNPSLTFIHYSSSLIFSGIVSASHHRIQECILIIGSLLAISFLLAIQMVLIFMAVLEKMPAILFGITMMFTFLLSAFAAVLRSCLTSIVGVLPQEYTVPLLGGHASARFFIVSLKIICMLIYNTNPRMNSLSFFMIAILFELIAIVCYIFMRHLSLYKYYFGEVTDQKESPFVQEKCATVFEDIPMDGRKEQNADEQPDSILVVLWQMWPMALMIFINTVITISLFPSIFADVQSSLAPANSPWDKFFVPVGCFLLSSLGSVSGRMSTALIHFPRENSPLLPLFVIARGLFIPLIMLCNVSPRNHTTPWFQHDAWFMIFNILFMFSDGYFITFITSCGPKIALPKNAKTAGSLMVFCTSIGCINGAALSFLIRWII